MKSLSTFDGIFIHKAPVDMRKSINGLSIIVDQEMKLDLRRNYLFIFINKRRTHMKMLYFDRTGFAIWFKRLEESRYPWIKKVDEEALEIKLEDLKLLLEGINIWSRFENVCFDSVV